MVKMTDHDEENVDRLSVNEREMLTANTRVDDE